MKTGARPSPSLSPFYFRLLCCSLRKMRGTPTTDRGRTALAACALLLALSAAAAQSGRQAKEAKTPARPAASPAPLLKRTTTRREVRRLGFGGSVSLLGAP